MKKVITGGFLTMSGMTGISFITAAAVINPTSAWTTPPGRFMTTLAETGAVIPFAIAVILLVAGLTILAAAGKE